MTSAATSANAVPPSTGEPGKGRWAEPLKLLVILLGAVSVTVGAPFSISALSEMNGGNALAAGSVVTTELASMTVAGILVVPWLVGRDLRRALGVALLAATLGNMISMAVSDMSVIAVARALTGAGNGVVICVVMTLAGRRTNAQATFAILTAGMSALGIALAMILPHLILIGGYRALVACCAAITIAGLLMVVAMRRIDPIERGLSECGRVIVSPAAWAALTAIGLLILGHSVLHFLIVSIGSDIHLSTIQSGWIVAGGSLLSVLAPAVLSLVPEERVADRLLPLLLLLMFASAMAMGNVEQAAPFVLLSLLYIVLPTLLMPVALGRMALADRSGRLAGAHPPFAMTGAALAPLVGGFAYQHGGGAGVSIAASCFIVGGGVVLIGALSRLTKGAPPAVMPSNIGDDNGISG